MNLLSKLKTQYKSAFTLIELLLVLSIGSMVILNVIAFIAEQAYKERMRISAQNVTTINSAYMRRVMHDGLDFSNFDPAAEVLYFENNDEMEDFLTYLNPDESCAGAIWEPKGTESGDLMRETPLISCDLMRNLDTAFGLEFSAVMVKDDADVARNILGLKIIIDYSDSELFNESSTTLGYGLSGSARVIQYMDMLGARLPSDLIGTQRITLSTISDPEDFAASSYEERDVNECFLGGGEDCFIVMEINFSGGFNQQYLRTDGMNAMLAPVKFALSGADSEAEEYQQCIIWTQDSAGDWTTSLDSDVVNCGVLGGEDHEYEQGRLSGTQAVTDNVQTEGLYITVKDDGGGTTVPVDHLCSIFTSTASDGFVDPFNDGIDAPCGIYNTSRHIGGSSDPNDAIIQAVTDSIISELIEVEDLRAYNMTSRRVRIRRDSSNSDNVVFEIEESDGDPRYTVSYDSASGDYIFETVGRVDIRGQLDVDGDTNLNIGDSNSFNIISSEGNITFESSTDNRIAMTADRLRMSIADLEYIGTNAILEINQVDADINEFNLSGDNLNVDSNINIRPDNDLVSEGSAGIYSEFSTFLNSVSSDSYSDEFKRMVTQDNIMHLKHFQSKINLRYVNVASGTNAVVSKPNCLDGIPADEQEIYNESADYNFDFNNGEDYARIVLVPITFRTYSGNFGQNQYYTHHAQDAGDSWNLYFYLTGDGISGTGAREDGAGSSLVMIYCDYSSILN